MDFNLFHPSAKTIYPSLVYFGGMRKYKRPQEILYVLKTLIEKFGDLKLFIIGTGPEEQDMKRLANEFNVQNFIEFRGRISNRELSYIVASSWLNVHSFKNIFDKKYTLHRPLISSHPAEIHQCRK